MKDGKQSLVTILRLGHRRERDKRITSHLGLTARAFGADEMILSGDEDNSVLETCNSISISFGGSFTCSYEPKPTNLLRGISKSSNTTIIHLTMYGENFEKVIPEIPRNKDSIIVVGGSKVPSEVLQISDFNVSVGNHPHSEVAALAVFLDSWIGDFDEEQKFQGGKIKVIPSRRRKIVANMEEE